VNWFQDLVATANVAAALNPLTDKHQSEVAK
jgi:hypothetical protein